MKNWFNKIYACEYASDLRSYEHYFPCRLEFFRPNFHFCLISFRVSYSFLYPQFAYMIFIYLRSKVTPGGFNTHLALYRCKYQPEMKKVRILTISSLTCLFSLLLYERDGEWKSNVNFPFRIRLLTPVCVLRQNNSLSIFDETVLDEH